MLPEFVKIQNQKPAKPPVARKVFIVERKALEHSAILRDLFSNLQERGGADLSEEVIPIYSDISDDSLKIILGWMTEYKDLRKAEDDDAPVTDSGRLTFTDWEKKTFDEISEWGLFELLIGTNYLEIKRLRELGCMTVANMARGKPAPEIRKIFNIVCDFTEEEKKKHKKETEWAIGRDESEATTT